MMKKTMVPVALSIALMGGMATTGYAAAKRTNSYLSNATLTVAEPTDALKLDPQTTADIPSANVFMNIFDNLVTQNAQGKIVPMLATSWTHTARDWIFNLRSHVRFSNGDPFNATVVKESFDRILNPATASPRASLFSAIGQIKVLSPTRVEFVMKQPFAPFLANLSNYAGGIVDPLAVKKEGAAYGQHPVGTGPFELSSWQPGNKLVLTRNPYYWGAKPKLAKIVYLVVPNDATRLSMLESNQVQVVQGVPPSQIVSLQHTPGVQIDTVPGYALEYIGFNDTYGPFKNVLVRQALTYATNRASILKNIYDGTASLATGPMPTTVWGSTSHVKQYGYNVPLARKLLAKAGYGKGFSTTLYLPSSDQTWMQVAQVVQSEWAQVGVKVSIQTLEWGTFLQYTAQGKTPVFILAWSNMTGDGDYNQYYLWDSHSIGMGGNRDFYSNPRVDALIQAARGQFNEALRKADYAKAQQLEAEQAPAIFLAFDKNVIAQSSNVHGVFQAHSSILFFKSAYVS